MCSSILKDSQLNEGKKEWLGLFIFLINIVEKIQIFKECQFQGNLLKFDIFNNICSDC